MAKMTKSKKGMGTGENKQYMKPGGTKKAVPSKKMGGKYMAGGNKKGM